jgi:lipid-A-disaccharide synthase
MSGGGARPPRIFLVAGEESGDILGAALMAALAARLGPDLRFMGIGGERMGRAGLPSLFPMHELALHGVTEVIRHLPRLVARMRETVDAVVAAEPDVLVLVDAPAFNLRLARRVRRRAPGIPIVDYVSPTVWAHNPWRARRMAPIVDLVLAILPFEPAVHRKLGGPDCVYVGHPLLARLAELRPAPGERPPLSDGRPTLLVLPGSRRSEIRRLMAPFGAALALIAERHGDLDIVLPAVPRLREEIEARLASWPVRPRLVSGEREKLAAFRRAHAALAASGTVTLELALSGVPMAVAYRVDPLVRVLKPLFVARSIVLPNLVLDENAIPEFIDRDCRPDRLAGAVLPLLRDTPVRRAQLDAFARLDGLMATRGGKPAELAASAVVAVLAKRARLDGAGATAQRRLESGT